jgi:hypothetical protein
MNGYKNLTSKVLNVLKIQFARDLEMERIGDEG